MWKLIRLVVHFVFCYAFSMEQPSPLEASCDVVKEDCEPIILGLGREELKKRHEESEEKFNSNRWCELDFGSLTLALREKYIKNFLKDFPEDPDVLNFLPKWTTKYFSSLERQERLALAHICRRTQAFFNISTQISEQYELELYLLKMIYFAKYREDISFGVYRRRDFDKQKK